MEIVIKELFDHIESLLHQEPFTITVEPTSETVKLLDAIDEFLGLSKIDNDLVDYRYIDSEALFLFLRKHIEDVILSSVETKEEVVLPDDFP